MKRIIACFICLLMVAVLPASALAAPANRDTAIHEVNIYGLSPAVAGSTPLDSYTLWVDEGEPYNIVYQYWHDSTLDQDIFVEETPFEASHSYALGCIIGAADGYYFADDCVFKMNGSAELVDPSYPQQYYLGGWLIVQSIGMPCSAGVQGDVNGSGAVDANDALLLMRYALGLVGETELDLSVADFDANGQVNANDALAIMRHALGLR